MPVILTKDHRYILEGVQYPSVTQILGSLGITYDYGDRAAVAAAYGTAVHSMVLLDIMDVLDEENLDPNLKNPLAGWRKFKKEYPEFRPYRIPKTNELLCEVPMVSKFGFAGTPDIFATMGKEYHLPDIKTRRAQPYDGLQTAAYEQLIRERTGITAPIKRFVLELYYDSEDYRYVPMKEKIDKTAWMSCFNVYRWKSKFGKVK